MNGEVKMNFGMQAHLQCLHFEASATMMVELKSAMTPAEMNPDHERDSHRECNLLDFQKSLQTGSELLQEQVQSYDL